MKLLTDIFLQPYKTKANPFPTSLGEFVFYRTYSRYKEKTHVREMWWETVARTVEYNCGLVEGVSQFEAEKIFDNIYHLRQFPSGRSMWTGGCEVANKYPTANFNCSFTVVDSLKAFYDTFYLLMVGSGVGLRISKEDIKKLPKFRNDMEVKMLPYDPYDKGDRLEDTCIDRVGNEHFITVGDSKEGLRDALRAYFEILTEEMGGTRVNFIWDNVRPKGELLLTFGGFASGHESFQTMFEKITQVIQSSTGWLKPIDCLDIGNIIGEAVVAGGTRRTALLYLIDPGDTECIEAKSHMYNEDFSVKPELAHRRTSNNSIAYQSKPSREQIQWQIDTMRRSGEPAFVNMEAGRKRFPEMEGVNPCFTGDMRLLTIDGYKRFDELVGTEPIIINKDGKPVKSKVWCSGMKKTVIIKREGKQDIVCTPDHRFMLHDGTEAEAKDLKGKYLKGFPNGNAEFVLAVYETDLLEKVYDFTEPETHWGVVEGVVVHNCSEILMRRNQMCNLTTVNVLAFVKNGELDWESLLEAQRLSLRIGLRMATIKLELDGWGEYEKPLTGCSLTGWKDAMNALGFSKLREDLLFEALRDEVKQEAYTYAKELGIEMPDLATTLKPEGTISLLPTVSSGIHYSHSEYFIRRVRINKDNPLAKAMREMKFVVEDDKVDPNLDVISFPVHSPKGKTKDDVSAIDQLEGYRRVMRSYVDMNCSITVHVRDNEWDDVVEWMYENWDDVVGISFIPLSDSHYPQMPFEAIDEVSYQRLKDKTPYFNPDMLTAFEKEHTEFDMEDDVECSAGGACPIK